MPTNLSKFNDLFLVNFMLSNEMWTLQNGSEEGKMSNILRNQI